jgi:hypothetical protein
MGVVQTLYLVSRIEGGLVLPGAGIGSDGHSPTQVGRCTDRPYAVARPGSAS